MCHCKPADSNREHRRRHGVQPRCPSTPNLLSAGKTQICCRLLHAGPLLVQNYGAPQFLAFFASAGVASSLMAHAGRLRAAVPSGSLGMSGAVYAVVVAVATLYPKLQAQFIFLPFIPITLDVLVPGEPAKKWSMKHATAVHKCIQTQRIFLKFIPIIPDIPVQVRLQ